MFIRMSIGSQKGEQKLSIELTNAAGLRSTDQANLIDLEPDISATVKIGTVTAAVGHPHYHGSNVMWPRIVPEGLDHTAGRNGGDFIGNSTIGIAAQCVLGWIKNRVVAVPFTLNSILACRRVVWYETLVICARDYVKEDTTMGGSGTGQGQSGSKRSDCSHSVNLRAGSRAIWTKSKGERRAMIWRYQEIWQIRGGIALHYVCLYHSLVGMPSRLFILMILLFFGRSRIKEYVDIHLFSRSVVSG